MKKSLLILTVLVSLISSNIIFAEDVMLNITPTSITEGTDKNGNQFKRLVFQEEKSLNGVKYKTSSVIMVFQDAIQQLETIKLNEPVKLIVSKSDYKGRDSYTLLAVVQ